MKKQNIFALCLLMAMAVALPVKAQQTNSAYFTDGYLYRHQMNPAFGNTQDYFSMPALGNMSFGMNGNLSATDLIYNVNGETVTFMNPGVSLEQFQKNIDKDNIVDMTNRITLLSVGFQAWGGYNTIDFGLRDEVHTSIPGTLLLLAKEGLENQTYDITNFKVNALVLGEIAFGHSRQITDQWRVGGKFKVLLGGGQLQAHFNKATLTLGEDAYTATTNAIIETNMKGFEYKTTTAEPKSGQASYDYVSGAKIKSPGIAGWGLGLDLGAEFKLNDDWRFSAAALDLGFVSWNNNMVASTNGDKVFDTNEYTFSTNKDASNSFENEMNRFTDNLAKLYRLEDNGNTGSRTQALAARLNFGAEYCCPFYRPLTFGLMNSTYINGEYTWTDFRLSANCAPLKWLAGTIDFGYGTYGPSFGWMLNIHPVGFNIFCGMDYLWGKVAKNGVPLTNNLQLNIGINFPLN